jgi:hypothetical protein
MLLLQGGAEIIGDKCLYHESLIAQTLILTLSGEGFVYHSEERKDMSRTNVVNPTCTTFTGMAPDLIPLPGGPPTRSSRSTLRSSARSSPTTKSASVTGYGSVSETQPSMPMIFMTTITRPTARPRVLRFPAGLGERCW